MLLARIIRLAKSWLLAVLVALPFAAGSAQDAPSAPPSCQAASGRAAECPPALVDDWRGLATIPAPMLRVWSSQKTSGFELGRHRELASADSTRCSDSLVFAQYHQDVLRQFDATAHFDNCAFEASFHAIDRELRGVDDLVAAKDLDLTRALKAMSNLGRVLHAVQDFYAHSNWVELQHQAGATIESSVIHVWLPEEQRRLREMKGLVSGVVWWDGPKTCPAGTPAHAELAKDSPQSHAGSVPLASWDGMAAYSAAYLLASRATADFMAWSYRRWPALERECKHELYTPILLDRRSDP